MREWKPLLQADQQLYTPSEGRGETSPHWFDGVELSELKGIRVKQREREKGPSIIFTMM